MTEMSAATVDSIKALVEDRRISRIVYMHADHFEPWRSGIKQQSADALVAFSEAARKSEFSRNMSLFYKPNVPVRFESTVGGIVGKRLAGEPLVFRQRSDTEIRIAREAMQQLMRNGNHEIHVHLHHEGLTASESAIAPAIADWLAANSSAERDASRFELLLNLSLNAICEDTGLALGNWGFVHGLWALNGSDPSVRRIADELVILQRNGCFGDFTFPAGRAGVNPRIEQPFTCLPITAHRGYDLPEAEPRPVLPGSNAFAPGRLFIWSSIIKHTHCCIDYYGGRHDRMDNTEEFVLRWIRDLFQFDGTVYVKTHSHSMAPEYWRARAVPVIPHLYSAVREICAQLAEVVAKLGVALEFGSARSIFDELALGSGPGPAHAVA